MTTPPSFNIEIRNILTSSAPDPSTDQPSPDTEKLVLPGTRNPRQNQGLFSTRDIPTDEVIASIPSTKVIAILDTKNLKKRCYLCFWTDEGDGVYEVVSVGSGRKVGERKLKVCGGCKVVRFCCLKCQKKAWTSQHHKSECSVFKTLHPRILPHTVRAVMRLLFMLRNEQSEAQSPSTTTSLPPHLRQELPLSEAIESLESHLPIYHIAEGERWENMCLMAQATKSYSGLTDEEFSFRFVLEILCKVSINSFTLSTETFDPMGLVFDPFLIAKANHSCEPNAVVRFETEVDQDFRAGQTRASGRARFELVPLRKIDREEEITISYIDQFLPLVERRAELMERYFFECQCQKCIREDDSSGSSNHETEKYRKAVELMDLTSTADYVGNNGNEKEIKTLKDAVDTLYRCAEPKEQTNAPPETQETNVKDRIDDIRTDKSHYTWPVQIHPYPALQQKLTVAYIAAGDYTQALRHAFIQVFTVDPLLYPSTIETNPGMISDGNRATLKMNVAEQRDTTTTDRDAIIHDSPSIHPLSIVHKLVLIRLINAVLDNHVQKNLSDKKNLLSDKRDPENESHNDMDSLFKSIDLGFWRGQILESLAMIITLTPRGHLTRMIELEMVRIGIQSNSQTETLDKFMNRLSLTPASRKGQVSVKTSTQIQKQRSIMRRYLGLAVRGESV